VINRSVPIAGGRADLLPCRSSRRLLSQFFRCRLIDFKSRRIDDDLVDVARGLQRRKFVLDILTHHLRIAPGRIAHAAASGKPFRLRDRIDSRIPCRSL
jgi:hypothetical protein